MDGLGENMAFEEWRKALKIVDTGPMLASAYKKDRVTPKKAFLDIKRANTSRRECESWLFMDKFVEVMSGFLFELSDEKSFGKILGFVREDLGEECVERLLTNVFLSTLKSRLQGTDETESLNMIFKEADSKWLSETLLCICEGKGAFGVRKDKLNRFGMALLMAGAKTKNITEDGNRSARCLMLRQEREDVSHCKELFNELLERGGVEDLFPIFDVMEEAARGNGGFLSMVKSRMEARDLNEESAPGLEVRKRRL